MTDGNTLFYLNKTTVEGLAKLKRDFYRSNLDTTGDPTLTRRQRQWFWGMIAGTGPNVNFSDPTAVDNNTYKITAAFVNNQDESGDTNEAVEWAHVDSATPTYFTCTASNMAEDVSNTCLLPSGTPVKVYWDYDQNDPPTPQFFFHTAPLGLFPVTLTQDGGSDGGWDSGSELFYVPTYTYTVTLLNFQQVGTTQTPNMRVFPGSCVAANYGYGYFNGETFVLESTNEKPNVGPCDNFDGEIPEES